MRQATEKITDMSAKVESVGMNSKQQAILRDIPKKEFEFKSWP